MSPTKKNGFTLLCLVSLGGTGLTTSTAVLADIQDGRYGAAQVFDVQRFPAFPTAGQNFQISNFANPFGNGSDQVGQYTIGATEYIAFVDIDPAPATCDYEINLYEADGTLIRRITSGGDIFGLGAEGFLHVSNPGGFGTFVANSAGYNIGDSLNYTPDTGEATCAELEAYAASTTPTAIAGPVVPAPQPPAPTATPQPVPALPLWAWIATMLGVVVMARRSRGAQS